MDVFIRNVPPETTERQLREFLGQFLLPFGIHTFNCHKFKDKPNANLTIFDHELATRFLGRHGRPAGARGHALVPLRLHGRVLYCEPSKDAADPIMLACLQEEENQRQQKENKRIQANGRNPSPKLTSSFRIESLACGLWDYGPEGLTFLPYFVDSRQGSVVLGSKSIVILLNTHSMQAENVRIEVPYAIVDSIITGQRNDQASITLALCQAPAISELRQVKTLEDFFGDMSFFDVDSGFDRKTKFERVRACNLHKRHEGAFSACFVYRLVLLDRTQLHDFQTTIKGTRGTPPTIYRPTITREGVRDFGQEMDSLKYTLNDTENKSALPYSLRFQLQRLAQNGYLKPATVQKLVPYVVALASDFEEYTMVEAIRKLSRHLPIPGANIHARRFQVETLRDEIKRHAEGHVKVGSIYHIAQRHEHLALIHKVFVSPAGIYLDGPDLETKNRVLRKYTNHANNFVRLSFVDEDFGRFCINSQVSCETVFQSRFKPVLERTIDIAGKSFEFLGFSHSSLREAQCWMLAPIATDGTLIPAHDLIADLGNFSMIRSPAKCAARIGQAFSDATEAIPIRPETVYEISDIERNGRVFTDGVGTISEVLLGRVWEQFNQTRKQRATLLQIRFQGAKGMLALDSTLQGEKMCLRPSMIKFEASNATNLEICGTGARPLSFYLNRDFIKILEDLGVEAGAFLKLQSIAVEKLQMTIRSPVNAARFLEVNRIAINAQFPSLLRLLSEIGINFRDDTFARSVLELAALIQLREMKYRGRIPVENAYTLYGIADETGALNEGEVYCAIREGNGRKKVLLGQALITRAPGMHPGDIRIVRAVDIAQGSPLQNLHNCIVFSQHGARDLPSQLSGGDLDGDLFNVIFDVSLWPSRIYPPADYPRATPIDIGRTVQKTDIAKFFLDFLQSDQLGYICNTYKQIADQKPEGTLHPDCLKLAEMASIAVDYSKTGIRVDMQEMPRKFSRKLKPDFMANAPRLILDNELSLEGDETDSDDEEDAVNALNPDVSRVRYYKSNKVLGQLYRAIDDQQFLKEIKSVATDNEGSFTPDETVLRKAWDHVRRSTLHVPWFHLRNTAKQIRNVYEDNLTETLHQFSPYPRRPLTELEVLCGTILGKEGSFPNKRMRESSKDMKTKFDRDVSFTIRWITHGDAAHAGPVPVDIDSDEEDGGVALPKDDEALGRSIACFALAMEEAGQFVQHLGNLESFAYVAAAVCLREVKRNSDITLLG